MSFHSQMPSEFTRGLREQEDRARDLGLIRPDTPRAQDEEWQYWMIPNPIIYEETERGVQRYDLYSRLLRDRIIFLGKEIDDRVANLVTAQLLFLETEDPQKDVNFYINCPGGSITAGLAIYDTMQVVRSDVASVCIGQSASIASVLLASGTQGKRGALPHARIMVTQPFGGMQGQVTDLDIHYREIIKTRNRIYEIISTHTGRDFDEIVEACNRDKFFDASQAKEFGLIDNVIERPSGVTTPEA